MLTAPQSLPLSLTYPTLESLFSELYAETEKRKASMVANASYYTLVVAVLKAFTFPGDIKLNYTGTNLQVILIPDSKRPFAGELNELISVLSARLDREPALALDSYYPSFSFRWRMQAELLLDINVYVSINPALPYEGFRILTQPVKYTSTLYSYQIDDPTLKLLLRTT